MRGASHLRSLYRSVDDCDEQRALGHETDRIRCFLATFALTAFDLHCVRGVPRVQLPTAVGDVNLDSLAAKNNWEVLPAKQIYVLVINQVKYIKLLPIALRSIGTHPNWNTLHYNYHQCHRHMKTAKK